MRPVARLQKGLITVFYAWDKQSEGLSGMPSNLMPQDLQDVHDRHLKSSVWGDQKHGHKDGTELGRTLNLSTCKSFGLLSLEESVRECAEC